MEPRHSPNMALAPVMLGGLRSETIVLVVSTIGLFKPFIGTVTAMFVAAILGAIYQRITRDQPEGFLPYKLSSISGHWVLRRHLPAITQLMNSAWRNAGLPLAPSVQHRYEP